MKSTIKTFMIGILALVVIVQPYFFLMLISGGNVPGTAPSIWFCGAWLEAAILLLLFTIYKLGEHIEKNI